MKNFMKKSLVLVGLVIALQGCKGVEGTAEKVVLVSDSGEYEFQVEVMRTDEERERGLMNRDSLPKGNGMLFLFEEARPLSFWMKNVRFSIDIIFFSEDMKVLNVAREVPPCVTDPCNKYLSKDDAKYVLEVGAGKADEIGLKEGDEIKFLNIEELNAGN